MGETFSTLDSGLRDETVRVMDRLTEKGVGLSVPSTRVYAMKLRERSAEAMVVLFQYPRLGSTR